MSAVDGNAGCYAIFGGSGLRSLAIAMITGCALMGASSANAQVVFQFNIPHGFLAPHGGGGYPHHHWSGYGHAKHVARGVQKPTGTDATPPAASGTPLPQQTTGNEAAQLPTQVPSPATAPSNRVTPTTPSATPPAAPPPSEARSDFGDFEPAK